MKLKNAVVGQRVELKNHVVGDLSIGSIGTIVEVLSSGLPPIGVQWDNFTDGHNCGRKVTVPKSGWYVNPKDIRKLKEEPKPAEITVGSRVRRNDIDNRGDSMCVRVGDIGVVTEVLSGLYHIQFNQYGHACLSKHKVDLVD